MEDVPIGGLTCDTAGIISPAVGMVVVQQTTEALKILTENRDALRQKLISFDLWDNQQSTVDVSRMKKNELSILWRKPNISVSCI